MSDKEDKSKTNDDFYERGTSELDLATISESSEAPESINAPTKAKPGLETIYEGGVASKGDDPPAPNDDPPASNKATDAWDGFEDKGEWDNDGHEDLSASSLAAPSEPSYAKQKTDIRALPVEPSETQGARFVGLVDKFEGQEFSIAKRETSVGRTYDNDIVIVDKSVSREHAQLLNVDGEYILIDLRSANGTLVNGNAIARSKIHSGDEISFGNIAFRFFEIGDVFKPIDTSGAPVLPGAPRSFLYFFKTHRQLRTLILSSSILLLTLLSTLLIYFVRTHQEQGRPHKETVFYYYLQGVEAFKKRNWSEAQTQFNIILGLDAEHQRAKQYIQEVKKEQNAENQLEGAHVSLNKNSLGHAYAQASTIVDSVYTREAREIMKRIDDELDAKVARARMFIDANKTEEAYTLLKEVETTRPGRPDVFALLSKSKSASVEQGSSFPSNRLQDQTSTWVNDFKPAPSDAVSTELNLFKKGQIKAAIVKLKQNQNPSSAIPKLQVKLSKFHRVYESALVDYRAKKAVSAIKNLKLAKSLAEKVVQGSYPLLTRIDYQLSDMYYIQGIRPYLEGNYPEAYRYFKLAVFYQKNHNPSLQKLEALAEHAKKLFAAGYRVKGKDPKQAIRQWRRVMQIVPERNEYYQKAKKWLQLLSQTR